MFRSFLFLWCSTVRIRFILLFFSFYIFRSKFLSSCSDPLLSLLEVAEVFSEVFELKVFSSSECDLFLFVLVCGRLSRTAVRVTV